MKATITIENNPVSGAKVTIQVDDGSEVPVDRELRDQEAMRAAMGLDTAANVERTLFSGTATPEPEAEASIQMPSIVRAKPCTKCGDDMPLNSMYDMCANCRPQKVREKKEKVCKVCTRLGHPCKRHRNGEVKVTKPAVFLPGYEKTPEEVEALRPKTTNLPDETIVHGKKPVASVVAEKFIDPWNCQMCRDAEELCPLHASMFAEGTQPPLRKAGLEMRGL